MTGEEGAAFGMTGEEEAAFGMRGKGRSVRNDRGNILFRSKTLCVSNVNRT